MPESMRVAGPSHGSLADSHPSGTGGASGKFGVCVTRFPRVCNFPRWCHARCPGWPGRLVHESGLDLDLGVRPLGARLIGASASVAFPAGGSSCTACRHRGVERTHCRIADRTRPVVGSGLRQHRSSSPTALRAARGNRIRDDLQRRTPRRSGSLRCCRDGAPRLAFDRVGIPGAGG